MSVLFAQVLRMEPDDCVAFIGAGGKTTAMFKLARELKSNAIITSTTHLGSWQTSLADKHISTEAEILDEIEDVLQGVLLITGKSDGDRTKPINDKLLRWLYQYCKSHSIPLLIEADGSRQKPLKAWSEHEPPIPTFVDLVVQVVGLSGLGNLLTEENVHRSEIFSNISGLDLDDAVSIAALVQVLTHSSGGLKNIPASAKKIVLLNQADTQDLQSMARTMVSPLLTAYRSVIVASLANNKIYAVHESIAGIVLAAGGSTRFGKPKQLLDWKGESFVRSVAQTAIQTGLSPVIVVIGSNAEQVEATINDLDVTIVRNENWQSGQGSSIQKGIEKLNIPGQSRTGGAIFLLADQPQVGTTIIHALKEKHSEELYPIVAPMVIDRRGNPVLFDRITFLDLMNIKGDTGGRAIFHKHRVEYLPWHDDSLLLDVDTPEQYQRLIDSEDL